MEASNVAVLLVTANYLTSRFILDVEVPRLLQRRDREGIEVFPVIVKPCCWDRVDWLARLNLRPRDARPLASEDERRIEDLLAALSGEIVDLCKPAPEPAPGVPERPHPASAPAPEPSAAPPPAAASPPSAASPTPEPAPPAPTEAPAAPGAGIEPVIVLPFADLTGDHDLSYLCDGLVDELIYALTGVPGLRVASQISTFQFKSREVELEELRRRMGVGAAVQGSVQRAGERLRVGVRLVHLDGAGTAEPKRASRRAWSVSTARSRGSPGSPAPTPAWPWPTSRSAATGPWPRTRPCPRPGRRAGGRAPAPLTPLSRPARPPASLRCRRPGARRRRSSPWRSRSACR